jgi:hypothetical protein
LKTTFFSLLWIAACGILNSRNWVDSAVSQELVLRLDKHITSPEKAPVMETVHEDRFVVFLRHDRGASPRPDYAERPLRSCSTYEEARQLQRQLRESERECIIRYIGPSGGGD